MIKIKEIDHWLDKAQLICTKTDGKTKYNFSNFTFPSKFPSRIYNKDFTVQELEDDQQKLNILINKLNNDYNPKKKMKIKKKIRCLKVCKKTVFFIRKEIITALRVVFFSTQMDIKWKKNQMKNQMKTNLLNILRINQKLLTMNCLKNILILQHLLI